MALPPKALPGQVKHLAGDAVSLVKRVYDLSESEAVKLKLTADAVQEIDKQLRLAASAYLRVLQLLNGARPYDGSPSAD